MNGELRRRAVAIIAGKQADPDEKLDLLLGIALDTCSAVESHDDRITTLEVYPDTIKRVVKLLLSVGALAAAIVGIAALIGV